MIMGHRYVFWAARYVTTSPWGSNLGLYVRAHIEWRGHRGMLWNQLCHAPTYGQHSPQVLVIHLGGNDLMRHPGKPLIIDVLRDLT